MHEKYWKQYIKDLIESCSGMFGYDDPTPEDIEEIFERLDGNDNFWAMVDDAIHQTIEDIAWEKEKEKALSPFKDYSRLPGCDPFEEDE